MSDRWRAVRESPGVRRATALILVFSVVLLWAYWPTLVLMTQRWSDDPKYSHGFLVPVFAALVLWVRRSEHPDVSLQLSMTGLPWIVVATIMRLFAASLYLEWLDTLSLLPALFGLCSLLGGWPALRWAWPSILFLIFMMPAPFQLEVALAMPLQRMATACSTYCLQTLGLPAVAEGNVIWIDEIPLRVVEACSGLGMLITFFALSTAVALVWARTWGERIVLFASAAPIAVLANVVRITLTGVLHVTVGSGVAHFVYHDLAGWFMIPLALALLWLELKFLTHLFVATADEGPVAMAPQSPPPVERRPTRSSTPVAELDPHR